MVDTATKKAILQTILESQEFLTSKTHQRLLTYLVNVSIKGESPKEYSIANDVFDKGQDFNPNEDTTVRVYLHNLRKKLEHYYRSEGKHDKVVMEIPKGHYEVRFVNRSRAVATISPASISTRHILFAIFIAGLIFISFYLVYQNRTLRTQITNSDIVPDDNPVWKEFLDNDRPVIIVLGDHFFYQQLNEETNRWQIVRDTSINSVQELQDYETQLTKTIIDEKTDTPYFAMNSVWPVADILPILNGHNVSYSFRFSSTLTSHDLTDNDIIFVGSHKTLGVFRSVLTKINMEIKSQPYGIFFHSSLEDTLTNFYTSEGNANKFHKDLCAIAKMPGPVGNTILVLSSFHATGTCGAAEFLRDSQSLSEFENMFEDKFGQMPLYFNAILQVTGYERTSFQSQVIDFAKIAENAELW